MPTLFFDNQTIELKPGESVLDALLRTGVSVPHSCRAGACQSCLMRSLEGQAPAAAQVGLKSTLREQGYFLACSWRPETDVRVATVGNDVRMETEILGLKELAGRVMQVRLSVPDGFSFHPGQFITLIHPEGIARSYSLAGLNDEGHLELHVRHIPGGWMSGWLFEKARPGDRMSIQGPSGDCFYTSGAEDQPMLLVGTGTGLAPLWGIAREAIRRGHRGAIWLFHGALNPEGLYHVQELRRLSEQSPEFRYIPCTLHGNGDDSIEVGPIDQSIAKRFKSLKGWRTYLCGHPDLVKTLKMKMFLSGVAMKDIYADSFTPSATN